jgi:hypothetical protein
MANIKYLLDEYPGNEAWSNFVACFLVEWQSFEKKEKLVSRLDEDIAIVLSYFVGDNWLSWLESKVPALDGATPAEVMAKYPDGKTAIRSLLMRMPV